MKGPLFILALFLFLSVATSLTKTKADIFVCPTLTNPTTVVLDDTNNVYWGKGSTADIIVVARNNMTLTKTVKIQNVRNVVIVGIHFTINRPAWALPNDTQQHHALRFQLVTGTAWVEGVLIDNSGGKMGEGIDFWSGSSGDGALVVVNSRITGTTTIPGDGGCAGKFAYDHYDLIQTTGGYLGLLNVSLTNGSYQGIMTNGHDGLYKGIFMKNVNLNNIVKYAIMFWELSTTSVIVQQLDNVYYNETGSCYDSGQQAAMAYRIWPDPNEPDGSYPTASGLVFNRTSYIEKGLTIKRGNPPKGDYAPAAQVGKSYNASYFRK